MRKIIILFITLSLLVCFVSCTNEQVSEIVQTTDQPQTEAEIIERTEITTDENEIIQQTTDDLQAETEIIESTEVTTDEDEVIDNGVFLKNITAWQYGSSEAEGLQTDHKNNFSYNEHDYQDESLPQTVKVDMQGTEYTLTYKGSVDGPLYGDTIHKYSDGTRQQWFDKDMGRCVFYSNNYKTGEEVTCTQEEQVQIAYSFLESLVINPEQYQITKEEYLSGTNSLYIDFTRMNNEIATCDLIKLRVNKEGVITMFKLEHVNEMSDVPLIPEEIVQRVYKSLESEVQSIYRQVAKQEGYEITYKAEIDKLVKLNDGRLALDCHVSVKVTSPDGEILTEGAWFIIPITEPTIQVE